MNQSIRESIFHLKKITSFAYRDLTVERKRESIIGGRKKAVEIFVSRREHCRAHSPLDACYGFLHMLPVAFWFCWRKKK